MKGFVVYATNKTVGNETQVQLFGRLENNDSFVAIIPFQHYFYIAESDSKKIQLLLSKYKVEKTKKTNFKGKKVLKISSESYTELNRLQEQVHKKKLHTYEADVKPEKRFMLDNDLLGTIEIEGHWESSEKVDRIYTSPEIKSVSHEDFKPSLKIISLDIESDKNTGKLFCVGLYSKNYKKNFLLSKKQVKDSVSCETEKELLEKFKEELIKQDPDILTGWHVIDFDLAYLRERFNKNKVAFDIGRTDSNPIIRIYSNFFKSSQANIPGRQILDALNLIRDPFIKEAPQIKNAKFDSYTLEDVSQSLLGEGKTLKGKKRHNEIEKLYKTNLPKLVEYNLQDCKLAYDLITKTKIIDLAIERSTLTGMPLNKITTSIAAFDSLYIREANKRGLVSPTTKYERKPERITGGYVMESKAGIYNNILMLDFKSLYPSIIKTFNIDPASFLEKPSKKIKTIKSPNKAYFINQPGVLPQIIEKLHKAREKAKKENRELSSYAIKIIMNSFFGVLASPNCRYFSLDMANAITHFGQHIIKLTAKEIEKKGEKVIYSDTDSVFVDVKINNVAEAEKIGSNIESHINTFYEKYVSKNYDRKSYLELEFQKLYKAFMIPPTRGNETGSKKRYAGLLHLKSREKIEIVGLEAIRGDWTEAAQEFQVKLLDKIFHKEEFVNFIRKYVKELQSGKLDSKLVYTKNLRKPVEEYTKTTPPHVKAARKIPNLQSSVIQYYITTEGPEPIQYHTHKIDYEHYIKKQLAPIANTLLFFFDKNFEEIIQTSKQMKLF